MSPAAAVARAAAARGEAKVRSSSFPPRHIRVNTVVLVGAVVRALGAPSTPVGIDAEAERFLEPVDDPERIPVADVVIVRRGELRGAVIQPRAAAVEAHVEGAEHLKRPGETDAGLDVERRVALV